MVANAAEIVAFWNEAGRDRWFKKDAAFDDINLSHAKFNNVNFSHAAIQHACYEGMTIDGILVTDLLQAYREKNA